MAATSLPNLRASQVNQVGMAPNPASTTRLPSSHSSQGSQPCLSPQGASSSRLPSSQSTSTQGSSGIQVAGPIRFSISRQIQPSQHPNTPVSTSRVGHFYTNSFFF